MLNIKAISKLNDETFEYDDVEYGIDFKKETNEFYTFIVLSKESDFKMYFILKRNYEIINGNKMYLMICEVTQKDGSVHGKSIYVDFRGIKDLTQFILQIKRQIIFYLNGEWQINYDK